MSDIESVTLFHVEFKDTTIEWMGCVKAEGRNIIEVGYQGENYRFTLDEFLERLGVEDGGCDKETSGRHGGEVIDQVFDIIREERKLQNKKWGEQNHDDYRWLAILTEEVGELAEAILHDEFGGKAKGHAYTELLHVASVAVQWLECMDRRNKELTNE